MRSSEEQSQRRAEDAAWNLRSRLQRELVLQVGGLRLRPKAPHWGWSFLLEKREFANSL